MPALFRIPLAYPPVTLVLLSVLRSPKGYTLCAAVVLSVLATL